MTIEYQSAARRAGRPFALAYLNHDLDANLQHKASLDGIDGGKRNGGMSKCLGTWVEGAIYSELRDS